MKQETILCMVAHPDDELIGMGGTLFKYAKLGKRIITVIFSSGEQSDPLVQKEILRTTRIEESKKVGKLMKVQEVVFLGIEDGKIRAFIKNESFLKKIETLIQEYKPDKIFTHTMGDAHLSGDHIAVNRIVVKVLKRMNYHNELYTFDVWSPLSILQRGYPKLYVDISDFFKRKIKAMDIFESQKASVYSLLPSVHVKARLYGNDIQCKYAEMFYKIR